MTAEGIDLASYLDRISYSGPSEPSLAVLSAVVSAHTAAIPYENIDVLLKREVGLDFGSLQRKPVHGRRGGYCYEQNTLVSAALDALGFTVTPLCARVLRGLPDPTQARRNHEVLRVDLPEGPYIVDVGFGNLTPTAPIALRPDEDQETSHEPFRLMSHENEFVLQVQLGDAWDSLFRFSLEPTPPVDFEMYNWFSSNFPRSPFLANLIVARPIVGGRASVFNRRFTVRDHDNRTNRRVLDGIDDYQDILVGEFGLALDDDELAAIAASMASHAADEEVHRAFR